MTRRKDILFICFMLGIIIGLSVGFLPRQFEINDGSIEVYKGIPMNPGACLHLNGTYIVSYNPDERQPFPSNSIGWENDFFNITLFPYDIATAVSFEVNLTGEPFIWSDGEFIVILKK